MPDIIEKTDAPAGTSTGYSLQIGQAGQGAINSLGDHDWWRVSLSAGQTYTIALVGIGSSGVRDPLVTIYNSSGASITSNDDGLPNNNSVVTFTASATGTYYIDAAAYNNAGTGRYGVSITTGSRATMDVPMGAGVIDSYTATGNNEYAWNATPGTGSTVTVGFRVTDDGLETNFSQFSSQQRTAVEQILQYYRDVCGLNLVNSGQTDDATILFCNYNYSDGSGGYAYYPGSTAATSQDGNIHINLAGGSSTSSLPVGSYSFYTLMHEFGHAVGLSHPGLYNAGVGQNITYSTHAQFTQDTQQYTVMSYFDETYTTGSYSGYADGLMLYDVYALQQIYGANTSTRSGNTVYGFNATAGGIYNFATTSTPAMCIWDGGGIDTLDLSGYSSAQTISLVAGSFSNVGGMTGNISIAYNCTIENVVGGTGSDTITGNSANNTIRGGGGSDAFNGGAGRDVAVFNANWSAATLSQNASTLAWTINVSGQSATLTNVEVAQFNDRTVALRERPKNDFDGNNCSDILWRNNSTGAIIQWNMSDRTVVSSASIGGDASWNVIGTGDFNGDGNWDLLWRNNSSGAVIGWSMSGTNVLNSAGLGGDLTWSICRTGDFNGDGKTDILWRNNTTGAILEWEMNGFSVTSAGCIGGDLTWAVTGTGDFNGDSRTDVLWRNNSTGAIIAWEMNGRTVTNSGGLGGDLTWTLSGTGDFNGDGKTDLLWRNASNGAVIEWEMNGRNVVSSGGIGGDLNWSLVSTGDYNGDGRCDLLWRINSSGGIVEWDMNGRTVLSSGGLSTGSTWSAVA